MEKKINIVELLKYCPEGMALDCTMFRNLEFEYIDKETTTYPIICRVKCSEEGYNRHAFTETGCYNAFEYSECVIFPKGKSTWEGFVPPCKFKDGDILSNGISICIYNGNENDKHYGCYVGVGHINFPNHFINRSQNSYFTKENARYATEEEKEKLFQAIKHNGYKWNSETKTLEKLIKPRFKVGDRIKWKGHDASGRIEKIEDTEYHVDYGYDDGIILVNLNIQDDYELVPDKFDINTLKPFESRVLVRNADGDLWKPAIYGFSHSQGCYVVGGVYWRQCIPYEANKELLGTVDECDEYYKTWK